jgi:TonB family protein
MKMLCLNKLSPGLIALAILFAGVSLEAQQSQGDAAPSTDQSHTATSQPTRVRVSSSVMGGLLLKRVPPEYPEKARKMRIQGTVMLDAVISREGKVSAVTVISGDPLLAKEAIKAAEKWKYKPYLLQGQPVEIETTIQMNFTLSGG